MNNKVIFSFGIHNHQPVGNFDHVIEDAYQKAYFPFVEVMNEFPDIPFALHNSGILWDWISRNHKEYLEIIRGMTGRSQLEILSAGYYEPILSIIPEKDQIGQLSMMNKFITNKLSCKARGCWLTERIWEPHMPDILKEAGLEFVVVDDAHFKSIGLKDSEIRTFFYTEENGSYVKVFPIDKKLRYLVPFSSPEETVSYMREIAEDRQNKDKIIVLADDGEKFGVWPGTHSLCYQQGWLRRFCAILEENRDWLRMMNFSDIIDEFTPSGIVYIPTASYSEMMEWALPLSVQIKHKKAREVLSSDPEIDEPADLIKGGFWRNFLVKYEESNWMHKRMLSVSALVERCGKETGYNETWNEARNHLYQAQCNCAYWHGLFGGLYLPHLRSAIFQHLIRAETIVENRVNERDEYLNYSAEDIDGDGIEEVSISSPLMKLIFKSKGASLREFDIFDPAFNLTDILRRREEIYHRKIPGIAADKPGRTASIHEIDFAKEDGLDSFLIYDSYQRMSLSDHFIEGDVGIDSFARSSYRECGGFTDAEFSHRIIGNNEEKSLLFSGRGEVSLDNRESEIRIDKLISVPESSAEFKADYSLSCESGGAKGFFAVENVFSLLAGNAPDRYFSFQGRSINKKNLASTGEEKDVDTVSLIDEWLNIKIDLQFKPLAKVWRFPIETVSNSESGYESIYQGSVIAAVWPLDIKKGEKSNMEIVVSVRRFKD
ncbi:MAG TPA: alpha-amylase/4-alpha-glucanotransferase domain-containing protein [Candidatus Krumholzibacteriaceae bacterium]|nr:alpha-amylase/4-alpha-glucanotransferase domain-containing protein [Candidatus Krumholzibacteriaceae bacterium]